MGGGIHGGFGATKGARDDAKGKQRFNSEEVGLIKELERNHTKFTKDDIVFITRDKTGQIVWLEQGNESVGLYHILETANNGQGHAKDFAESFGVNRGGIATFLKKVLERGEVVSDRITTRNNRNVCERIYKYKNNSILILFALGTNGFVVSAYPI